VVGLLVDDVTGTHPNKSREALAQGWPISSTVMLTTVAVATSDSAYGVAIGTVRRRLPALHRSRRRPAARRPPDQTAGLHRAQLAGLIAAE
jgi:hypothetical protein